MSTSTATRPLIACRAVAPVRRLAATQSLVLGVALAVAIGVRVMALDATGFAEDEIDKLHAADAYAHGNFVADGEHPALMKLAVLASTRAAAVWNARLRPAGATPIPIETAVRLPNALAGAAIALMLFLLVREFFSAAAGVVAAWLWALDPWALAVNRVAKEETFILLFLLAGAWCYERAKGIGARDRRQAERWFTAAGAAFGLTLASKYAPFFFGLHVVYAAAAYHGTDTVRPRLGRYLGAFAVAFLAANFPLLLPGNWATLATFLSGHAVEHTGYVFQGRIWENRFSATPGGLPAWFYAVAIATKTPLPVLGAMAIGMWQLARRPRERGTRFVAVFLLLTFFPYSIVATKFLRYMLPSIAMLDMAAAVGVVWLLAQAAGAPRAPRRAIAWATTAAIAIAPVGAWMAAAPVPSTYRNVVGRWLTPDTLWFPHDELYDAGLREAVRAVAGRAAPEATVETEAPGVVREYLDRLGRADVLVRRPEAGDPGPGDWLIVQEGRRYFETRAIVASARRSSPAVTIAVRGFRAAEVYYRAGP